MNNNIFNNKGFTMIEVLIALLILMISSIPIFYSSVQSHKNYLYAEKYYKATINAQNILTEIKSQLDRDIVIYNYESIDKKYKNNTYPLKLFDFLKFTSPEQLGLNINNYSYYVYIKKYEENENQKRDFILSNNNLLCEYRYTKLDLDLSVKNIKFKINKLKNIDDIVYNTSNVKVDDFGNINIVNNYSSEFKNNKINLNLDDIISDKNFKKLYIENYTSDDMEVNLYTNQDIKYNYNKDISIYSFNEKSHIKVNFYNKLYNSQGNYIIIVIVTDNSRDNKILTQLIDMYSYL